MTKTLYLTLLLSLTTFAVGQSNLFIHQPYVGLPHRQTGVVQIDSLNQLPPRIIFILDGLFEAALTDFESNLFFIKGQIIDLESWAAKDSTFQVNYNFVVPKYELFFELRDTSIGIQSYCIRVNLDQFGQIIRFDWPRENFNQRSAFIQLEELQKTALRYARKRRFKTNEYMTSLRFDAANQRLLWEFSFLQESTGDEDFQTQFYKVIGIDALFNYVQYEHDMSSQIISCFDIK
jgi:hypothetical protein